MVLGGYSSLFDNQAVAYSKFRPNYPQELFDIILTYCDLSDGNQTALDLATGTGQTAIQLAKTFSQVIAIDSNLAQLKQAPPGSGIVYQKGFAERTGLSSGSVDLVTASQALHWFELDSAFAEIARVLRPGGTFAAWCYGLPEVGDNSTATDLIHHLRFGHDALGPYWSERNKLVDEEYASIVPDPTLYRSVTRRRLYGHQQTTLDNLVGHFASAEPPEAGV